MQRIGKQIQLTVTEEMDIRMGEIAKKQKKSKAEIYRTMAGLGLDIYGDFEKTGVVKFADFTVKAHEMLKHWKSKRQLSLF